MILTATAQSARARPLILRAGGERVAVHDFLGGQGASSREPGPQAFTVFRSAGSESPSHFHEEDQFQLIIQGGGTLGAHDVQTWSVHYANRHTGYGPIIAGPEGITYITLRQIETQATWYLKDGHKPDRAEAKRQLRTPAFEALAPDELRNLSTVHAQALIEPHDDGLAAWLLRLPARAVAPVPRTDPGTGRYVFVVTGALDAASELLPVNSLLFASAEERDLHLAAAADGLEAVVLQFPGGERVTRRFGATQTEEKR